MHLEAYHEFEIPGFIDRISFCRGESINIRWYYLFVALGLVCAYDAWLESKVGRYHVKIEKQVLL